MTNDNKQDDLRKLMDEGFQSLNKELDENTPSLQWFEQMVLDQQAQLKARFKRDLIIFLFLACCILIVFFFTLFQMPILFLLLQAAIFVGGAIFTGITYMKKVKRI